jgi:hypothetical protein
MVKLNLRTKSIGTRVSEQEYARLERVVLAAAEDWSIVAGQFNQRRQGSMAVGGELEWFKNRGAVK